MSKPLVSVVVTTYNHEKFIGEAIDSVLAQTYANVEVIVVDDESADATPRVLATFGDRVVAIRQLNQGVAGARNTGIRRARGELLAFLDGDDRWHPEKLASQVAAYHAHPGSGLIACDVRHFDDRGIVWEGSLPRPTADGADEISGVVSRDYYRDLIRGNFIATTSQVMIPRAVLDAVGLSDATFPIASDYDLYLRIAASYPVTLVNRILTEWRYVATSVSGPQALRQLRWAEDIIAVLQKHARSADDIHRVEVAQALTAKARAIATQVYYSADPEVAGSSHRHLWRLFWKSADPVVGLFFLGSLIPESARSSIGPTIRRIFSLAREG
jgi:glycosyltransferase involved in cell wall biosynthesis